MKNRKSKIILSFDDGRKDNFDIVRPILLKYGLTATFNISTAYVDGTINDNEKPCKNPAMSIGNVQTLYKDGFEIACHGDRHKNIDSDIVAGLTKLRNWLNISSDSTLGLASPYSILDAEEILKKTNYYKKNHISYVRIGITDGNSLVKKIERKMSTITGSVKLYCKSFSTSVGKEINHFIYYSIPVMKKATSEQVIFLLKEAVKDRKDCILMFHSILNSGDPYYDDTWTWDKTRFEQLCRWLKDEINNDKLSVVRTRDII